MRRHEPRPLPRAAAFALPLAGALSTLLASQFLLPLVGVPEYIVPTPATIWWVFAGQWPLLADNLTPTVIEALAGFAIGNLAAVVMAVVFVQSRVLQAAYFPVVLFFNTIPILALSPVIIPIFGLGMTPKIVIAAITCYVPAHVNMIRGLDQHRRRR